MKPKMQEAFESKLVDMNEVFSNAEKKKYNLIGKPHLFVANVYNALKRVKAVMKGKKA